MPMPFEFVIYGPPLSYQTRRRNRVREWTQEVQNVAESRWDAEPPLVGEVMVTITYLHKGASMDVDSLPKPILDGLKGLVYSDDGQVSDLLCRKRDLNGDLRIQSPSSVLLETLGHSEPFLHIAVDNASSQEVAAW